MKKEKHFLNTRFSAECLREARSLVREICGDPAVDPRDIILRVQVDGATWDHDSIEEFFADYRRSTSKTLFFISCGDVDLTVAAHDDLSRIEVGGKDRSSIERIFEVFERAAPSCALPKIEVEQPPEPVIFIGHGRSQAWRDLKDHLSDKHSFRVEAYETGARAGHAIRDVLNSVTKRSTFAILVMTAEDLQGDGKWHARQNVVHEAGLFQGRLGFHRAIMLVEIGVELFSNVDGIQHIPFRKDGIRETFGDVVATLNREFPP